MGINFFLEQKITYLQKEHSKPAGPSWACEFSTNSICNTEDRAKLKWVSIDQVPEVLAYFASSAHTSMRKLTRSRCGRDTGFRATRPMTSKTAPQRAAPTIAVTAHNWLLKFESEHVERIPATMEYLRNNDHMVSEDKCAIRHAGLSAEGSLAIGKEETTNTKTAAQALLNPQNVDSLLQKPELDSDLTACRVLHKDRRMNEAQFERLVRHWII
jgi:hypothetical protein